MQGTIVGQYRVEEALGSGAHGTVYRGVHVRVPDIEVALKVLHPVLVADPQFVASLERECVLLHGLSHPGIVAFRDLVVDDQLAVMVVELLRGRDLHQVFETGAQDPDTVTRWLRAMLTPLAHAHRRGVLHQDIKPQNLFLCDDGTLKLLDFGIARAAQGSRGTRTGHVRGTLEYMAPERFRGQALPASDLYAAGLVAWELVSGERACPEGDLPTQLGWHVAGGVQRLSDCPDGLADVVERLTAADPTDRLADADEALSLLDRSGRRRQPAGTVDLSAADLGRGGVGRPTPSGAPSTVQAPVTQAPAPDPLPPAPAREGPAPWAWGVGAFLVLGVGWWAWPSDGSSAPEAKAVPVEPVVAAAPQPEPEPEPDTRPIVMSDADDLGSLMTHLYGNWSQRRETAIWRDAGEQWSSWDETIEAKVHTTLPFSHDGTRWMYVLTEVEPAGDLFECHGCAPGIGGALLEETATGWALETGTPQIQTMGSYGSLPNATKFSIQKLGDDVYAASTPVGYYGQGYHGSSAVFLAAIGGSIRGVLSAPVDAGYTSCSHTCDLAFEPGPADLYDAVLTPGKATGPDRGDDCQPESPCGDGLRYRFDGQTYEEI